MSLLISALKMEIFMRTVAVILYDPPWVRVPVPGSHVSIPSALARDPVSSFSYLNRILNSPLVEVHVSITSIALTVYSKHRDPQKEGEGKKSEDDLFSSAASSGFSDLPPLQSPGNYPKLVTATIEGVVLELGVRDFDQYVTAAAGALYLQGFPFFFSQRVFSLCFSLFLKNVDFVEADGSPYQYAISSVPFEKGRGEQKQGMGDEKEEEGNTCGKDLLKVRWHRIPKDSPLYRFTDMRLDILFGDLYVMFDKVLFGCLYYFAMKLQDTWTNVCASVLRFF